MSQLLRKSGQFLAHLTGCQGHFSPLLVVYGPYIDVPFRYLQQTTYGIDRQREEVLEKLSVA